MSNKGSLHYDRQIGYPPETVSTWPYHTILYLVVRAMRPSVIKRGKIAPIQCHNWFHVRHMMSSPMLCSMSCQMLYPMLYQCHVIVDVWFQVRCYVRFQIQCYIRWDVWLKIQCQIRCHVGLHIICRMSCPMPSPMSGFNIYFVNFRTRKISLIPFLFFWSLFS